MCSFACYFKKLGIKLTKLNKRLKPRGPDVTNVVSIYDYIFIHNLLNITGPPTVQPFYDKKSKVACLFNGEIYNYQSFGTYNSDGECIIPLYLKYGKDFIKQMDGDFAIVLFDFNNECVIISSDVFATKPVWYAIEDGKFYISTFESSVKAMNVTTQITKVPANTTLVFSLDGQLQNTLSVYDFDLTHQHKTTYDDWIEAFIQSIKKRAHGCTKPIFVCLSSGYDSGVIVCILEHLGIKFSTYTIDGIENPVIMKARLKQDRNVLLTIEKEEYHEKQKEIKQLCESMPTKMCSYVMQPFTKNLVRNSLIHLNTMLYLKKIKKCRIESKLNDIETVFGIDKNEPVFYEINKKKIKLFRKEGEEKIPIKIDETQMNSENVYYLVDYNKSHYFNELKYNVVDDWASVGLATIFTLAKEKQQRIYLSGQGGDEIYSDYGFEGLKYKSISQFGGKFPDDLTSIFPWNNFYDGSQKAFISKEEHIASMYGIEGRYPFLDKKVVQEFFWLTTELKNKYYKAPLYAVMEKFNYPFEPNEKIGFKVKKVLKQNNKKIKKN